VGETDPDHGFRGGWAKFVVLKAILRGELGSETYLAIRKPNELDGRRRNGLLAGSIDGSLPALKAEVAVDLEVFSDAFHHLEVDVVQGRSSWDKILGCFLIAHPHLEPLIAVQVISYPSLAPFALAPDPVAEKLPLVAVALPLDAFPVHEMTAIAVRDWRIGRNSFGAQV